MKPRIRMRPDPSSRSSPPHRSKDPAADQVARTRDPAHIRRLTEADSVAAVALACEADRLAQAAG